jgi:hypothetical protein
MTAKGVHQHWGRLRCICPKTEGIYKNNFVILAVMSRRLCWDEELTKESSRFRFRSSRVPTIKIIGMVGFHLV